MALDRQWAFDTALAGLREQGRQSLDEDGAACAYRGVGGIKCAIGFLIPDERYDTVFDEEILPADTPDVAEAVCGNREFSDKDLEFLSDLQRSIHDNLGERLVGLNREARKFAGRHKLQYRPLGREQA